MGIEVLGGYVEVAVFAELGLHEADDGVLVDFALLEHLSAVGALDRTVELLLVVFQKVFIVHFPAGGALDDVPAAVAEVRG
jgi:hypothetical protein